ncbi:MAG: hypothetical protein ABL933_10085 [Methyloglobulus sp.]|nr:hypothetical protein [Methyloglobulus sp.]
METQRISKCAPLWPFEFKIKFHSLVRIGLMGLVVLWMSVSVAAGVDPRIEPIPKLDFDDPSKAMVVRLKFDGRTNVALASAEVTFGRAHARIGDPPLLGVELFDDQDRFMEKFNAWHPLWAFLWEGGHEKRITLPSASGRFVLPFDPDLGTMKVTDIPLKQELIAVDLRPAVREFCDQNPDDSDCSVADLAINSISVQASSSLTLLGKLDNVVIRTFMTNLGPDSPIDANLTLNALPAPELSVKPIAAQQYSEPKLGLNESRQRDQSYTLQCLQPGSYSATFKARIDASRASVTDPNRNNNDGSTSLSVDCAVPVTIDIKPRKDPNIAKTKVATIPVSILSTGAGEYGNPIAFDATKIIQSSVRFGPRNLIINGNGGATPPHDRGHIKKVYELDGKTKDSDLDLVIHFRPVGTDLIVSDKESCVIGKFLQGSKLLTFFGCADISLTK